ncbi:MAG: alpha-amylase family glycosyl hydrolase [Sandaracinaceae bacterium]
MTQRVGTLWVLLIAMGCGGPPARDAGNGALDGAASDGGEDAGDERDGGSRVDAGVVSYPARSCDLTLRYAPPVGAGRVQVAGTFTDWQSAPLDMRDDDGDGVYEITLSPNARLASGQRYAYRWLVDGDRWFLDESSPLREYTDACLNSAFMMPACDAGPELRATPLRITRTGDTASIRAHVAILTAADGALPTDVTLALDATLVDAAAIRIAADGSRDVTLDGVPRGRHVLSVRARDAMGRDAEPIDLPFWIEDTQFSWRDAVMYMVVVDRFANGDPSNDAPVGAPVERPADFHGGDLNGVVAAMRGGYFDELGVNAIWLSPINRQADGAFVGRDGPHQFAGYHGYWPVRAREVEPRFGGDAALHELVDEAHRRGIRVLLDLINNQVHEQHEYVTAHGDWFRTGCVCGLDPGCGWSERPLDCLFASYLPDINWRVPGAEHQFIDDAVYWVDEFGVDGFRIDAVKHVETHSISNLRAALARRFEQGGERIFMVGETAVDASDHYDVGCGVSFPDGYTWIDAYVGERMLDGQFDFPTYHRTQSGLLTGDASYRDIEAALHDLEVRYRPDGVHVRFLGNHDGSRIASRANNDSLQGCRWAGDPGCASLPGAITDPYAFARLRRAFTVLYTTPGIPFLYYGDEVAVPGGQDPDNRRDMVFDGALSAIQISGGALTGLQRGLRTHLRELGQARAASVALRRGRRVPLLVTDDVYVVAYVAAAGEVAIMAANRGGTDVVDLAVDGLSSTMLGPVASFQRAAGVGSATRMGARVRLSVPANESVLLLGAP